MSRGRGGGNYNIVHDSPIERERLEAQKANQARRSTSVWDSSEPFDLIPRAGLVVALSGGTIALWQASGWFPPLGVFLLLSKGASFAVFYYRYRQPDKRYAFASCSFLGMCLGISLNLFLHDLFMWGNSAIDSLFAMF